MSHHAPASSGALAAIQLQDYLHAQIPLSAAMDVRVRRAEPHCVELWAPLAPNVNALHTAFGGSLASLATLSAWALLTLRLRIVNPQARLVIQRNVMSYERPVGGDFSAICPAPEEQSWQRFVRTLDRHGRARVRLNANVFYDGDRAGSFEGDFVALHP